MKYKALNYFYPDTPWIPKETTITKEEAVKSGLLSLSDPCFPNEFWILHNMMQDCLRLNINYAFVQEPNKCVSIWKAPHKRKAKCKS